MSESEETPIEPGSDAGLDDETRERLPDADDAPERVEAQEDDDEAGDEPQEGSEDEDEGEAAPA